PRFHECVPGIFSFPSMTTGSRKSPSCTNAEGVNVPGGGVLDTSGVCDVKSKGNRLDAAWKGVFDFALPNRLSKMRSWKVPKPPRIAVLPSPFGSQAKPIRG